MILKTVNFPGKTPLYHENNSKHGEEDRKPNIQNRSAKGKLANEATEKSSDAPISKEPLGGEQSKKYLVLCKCIVITFSSNNSGGYYDFLQVFEIY